MPEYPAVFCRCGCIPLTILLVHEYSTEFVFGFYHPFALPEESAMYEVNF